ncbi:MAG: GNAT family N-acetyltransferase [Ruminococcaceae bacterium]|nr:GNAT family N-acetyltransferase [Oscillospiraceae bacterium]
MLNIEYSEKFDDDIYSLIDTEFSKFADKNGVVCDYTSFGFIAKEDNKVVGVIRGHSSYNEVHISDLIILEQYRNSHIGTRLVEAVEKYCADNGFESITLSTYDFQAPEFYKKCGFEVEFIRENKKNPKLTKYFLIKHF